MMSRKNWIMLALLLMIPGAAGLGWGVQSQRAEQTQTAAAAKAISDAPSADEYLGMYEQWSQLTAAQKGENPWGQGQYGGPEIQKRLREDQALRLEADLLDLDAGLKSYPQQLAEALYGSYWAQSLAAFQRQRERRDLVMTGSAITLCAGGLLFLGGLIYTLITLAFKKTKDPVQEKTPSLKPAKYDSGDATTNPFPIAEKGGDVPSDAPDLAAKPSHPNGYFESVIKKKKHSDLHVAPQILPVSQERATAVAVAEPASSEEAYFGWAMGAEEESPSLSTMMTTEPITRGLSDLTEEVSAIRQYATAQQDQMRKLQDGYDWMLVRRFCLRIIRCIDNLNERIARLSGQDEVLLSCLEEIGDELVFALESSGVEQYRPDLNVQFKGLEKYAEAVRQRVPTSDPSQVGTIAEILRPGYQYLISDDDVKIVRCAQVKLYDMAETDVLRK